VRIDIESYVRMTELADYIVPFTIRAVSELGIADLLAAGPLPVTELAGRTGTHPPSLHRALRALASKGIFDEIEPGMFALTPLAQPLRSDHPLSLREAYPLLAADIDAWAHFDHSVRTGQASFDLVHGTDYWTWMAEHPHDSARTDASMAAVNTLHLRTVLPAYPWGELNTLVDVGGGNGAFLTGILARFADLRGTVVDLPHVVAAVGEVAARAGVADRVTAHPGSFFDSVPAGADAYLLKRVLYHWDDEQAVRLLSTIREAMTRQSKLVILEPVVSGGNRPDPGKLYDLLLLTMAGGGARTEDEVADILMAAGLRLNRVLPTMMFPVVEAVRSS
jgi:O-methyltransferase domain